MDSPTIKALIEELLTKLTVEFDRIDVVENETGVPPQFHIFSKDSRVLIGNGGSTLEAMSHIIHQMVRKQSTEDGSTYAFMVDVNNYHTKRREELLYKAQIVAERAKLFRRDVEMLPMSPYERMLIHAHFAQNPEITTESCGEGKFRRVVIKYQERSAEKIEL